MKENKILWVILFNIAIILSEIIFGLISNSFSLIADALHNTGDVLAIAITYLALILSRKKTTFKYTFGFIRAEMMAAFVNTLFLFITMIYLTYEAILRVYRPEVIEPLYMVAVGTIALVANSVSAYVLNNLGVVHEHTHEHHHHHEDANIKSAYLHMLSDAFISFGVVIAGIFIYFFKIYYIDSFLTIIFSIYILKHSYPLLKGSFLSLMDVNTTEISKNELDKIIKDDNSVIEYHDLHIHKPSSKLSFISFHIVLYDNMMHLKDIEHITDNIRQRLKKFGFNHIIIQVDSSTCKKGTIECIL